MYANECQLTAISVGYRLAPEHPHPAAVHDCIDAANYLAEHGRELYGAPLQFIAGESAGGCLALLCVFDFLRSHPSHHLLGLILFYGYFDLALGLPSVTTSTKYPMTNRAALERYCDAYLPVIPESERRDASISPLYQDLPALLAKYGAVLPPALFVCGSEDPLLDDTLLLSIKWNIAGGEAVVKVYPGAAHGFLIISGLPVADEAKSDALRFIRERLQEPHGNGL
jgi:acetyl esterase/lipase